MAQLNKILEFLRQKQVLLWSIAILLPFALFINLGEIPINLHTDESRRALVALEMVHSGNYLSPTLNGIPYLNKPPFYNWIIAGFFKVMGPTLLANRLPMILSLLFFVWITFVEGKKRIGTNNAIVAAIAVLVCGRILFYDSFIGLIDIGYSAVTFLAISYLYTGFYKRKYAYVYYAYGLMAIGFLMKGIPSLVFQGLSLLAVAYLLNGIKPLFNKHHFGAAFFGLGILVAYYFFYFQELQIPASEVFHTLLDQSTRRGPANFSMDEKLNHWLGFPLELIYHFLPFTLFGLVFIFRKSRQYLAENPYAKFLIAAYLINIPIYWYSVQVYPRYLFPFLPLLFIPVMGYINNNIKTDKVVFYGSLLFKCLLSLVPVVFLIACFIPQVQEASNGIVTSSILCIISIPFAFAIWKADFFQTSLLIAVLLLCVRIGFNTFILTDRIAYLEAKKKNIEIALEKAKGLPFRIYHPDMNTDPEVFDYVHNSVSYLVSVQEGEICYMDSVLQHPEAQYIISDRYAIPNGWSAFTIFHDDHLRFSIIRKQK